MQLTQYWAAILVCVLTLSFISLISISMCSTNYIFLGNKNYFEYEIDQQIFVVSLEVLGGYQKADVVVSHWLLTQNHKRVRTPSEKV